MSFLRDSPSIWHFLFSDLLFTTVIKIDYLKIMWHISFWGTKNENFTLHNFHILSVSPLQLGSWIVIPYKTGGRSHMTYMNHWNNFMHW